MPREPGARLARADSRGPPHRRAGGDPYSADRGQHVPAGLGDHRRGTPRCGGISRGPPGRHRSTAVDRRTLPGAGRTAAGIGAQQRMERLGRRRRKHALSTGSEGGSQRGSDTATQVEMGLRLCRRQLGTIAARGPRRARLRRQRQRRCRRARREAWLPVPGAITRRRASARRSASARTRRGRRTASRCISRTAPPSRMRSMRTPAARSGGARSTTMSMRARPARSTVLSGSRLRADCRRRRRGAGRHRALRVLHVPRQRVGTRCLDGSGDLEVVHDH